MTGTENINLDIKSWFTAEMGIHTYIGAIPDVQDWFGTIIESYRYEE